MSMKDKLSHLNLVEGDSSDYNVPHPSTWKAPEGFKYDDQPQRGAKLQIQIDEEAYLATKIPAVLEIAPVEAAALEIGLLESFRFIESPAPAPHEKASMDAYLPDNAIPGVPGFTGQIAVEKPAEPSAPVDKPKRKRTKKVAE